MPGVTLRQLAVQLGLDVDAQSFAKGQLLADGIKLGLGLIVQAAQYASRAIVGLVTDSVRFTSAIHDTAQAIGIGTTALQELQFAADISGVGAEELSGAVGILTRNMAAAAKGGGDAGAAFAKLGVKVKDAHGKLRPTEDVIGDLAEGIKNTKNPAEKTALALQTLGRGGARLVPLLNEGRAGVAALRQEAQDLGGVLDDKTINAGDDLGDTFQKLQVVTMGLKRSIGAALFPALTKIGESMIAWLRANREIIKQRLVTVLTAIAKAASVLGTVIGNTVRTIVFLVDTVALLVTGFWKLLGLLPGLQTIAVAAGIAIGTAWLFASAPILNIVAAVVALGVAFDDLRVYLQGGDSLIGRWIESLKEWTKPRSGDPWLLVKLREVLAYIVKVTEATAALYHLLDPKAFKASPKELQAISDAVTLRAARGRILSSKKGDEYVSDETAEALKRAGISQKTFIAHTRAQGLNQPLPAGYAESHAPGQGQGAGVLAQPFIPTAPPVAGGRTLQQTNSIQVIAAPGQSPEDVGDAVVRKINELGLIGTSQLEAAKAATGR